MNLLEELNARQVLAVTNTEGRIKVVAGAGSGKTRVLAHRYAYLVNELGVSPANVLCMTFTNKAAQEMRHRISRMTDRGNVNDFICTIHGFCVKFLRREIYRIGYPKNFTVMDEEDGKVLAKQAMDEFGIDRRKTTAERFLRGVAALKGYDPEAYIRLHLLPDGDKTAPDATVRYIQLQLKQFSLDFDDLLYFTIYILDNFPEAFNYWTSKLNYVLVDEVQDCSSDDWKLINRLVRGHGNMFVVGDPDQAIYEWRGAKPQMFVEMPADKTIILNENYRSTPQILDVANKVIANNHNRIPKDLFSNLPKGPKPVHWHCSSESEEAENIASLIEEGIKKGTECSDFAVLFRASFVSRRIEQALLKREIPYTVWGGVRFYERMEIKDILSYLRLIVNSADDMAFQRVINLPSRKFGKESMRKLAELAEAEGRSLYDTLSLHISDKTFNKPGLHEFLAIIERLRLMSDLLSVSELTDEMLKMTGLGDLYRNDEREDRLENVNELMSSMREFEATADEPSDRTAVAFLQLVALYTNPDLYKGKPGVRLMTIHQSKGLEFPHVIIAGLSEGNFPSHRTIRERRKAGEEEERRLMYVAITRAKRTLTLTESEGHLNDNSGFKYPSRFICEIPEDMIERRGDWTPELMEGTKMMAAMLDDELNGSASTPIPVGTKVRHKIFGEGIVEKYDRNNDSYSVRFNDFTRNLLPRVLDIIK